MKFFKSKSRKNGNRKTLVLSLLIFGIFAAWYLWSQPYGTGAHQQSPDGLYTANVSNMIEHSLFGPHLHYIEVEVVRNSDETIVSKSKYFHTEAATVPEYEDRSQKFIVWNEELTAFTVPIGSKKPMSIQVIDISRE